MEDRHMDNHREEMRKMHERMDKQRLERLAERALREARRVKEFAEDRNLLNSQEYLDFEDKLNAFSVMDHSADVAPEQPREVEPEVEVAPEEGYLMEEPEVAPEAADEDPGEQPS